MMHRGTLVWTMIQWTKFKWWKESWLKDVRSYNSNQLSMVKDAWPNKAEFCSAIGEADAAVKDTLFLNKCFVTYHTSSHELKRAFITH